jgi:hypothetical protein
MKLLIENELNKIICKDISKLLKKDAFLDYYNWDDNNAECDYIIVDANDTTKYIAGNLYMVLVNVSKITNKYYKCEYPVYSAYGVLERYKIVNGICKVNGVNVYVMNKIFDDISSKRLEPKEIILNNKCLKIDELVEIINDKKYVWNFKDHLVKYFNINVRCVLTEDNYTITDNMYKVNFNGFDLKKIVNDSKKQNFKDIIISNAISV